MNTKFATFLMVLALTICSQGQAYTISSFGESNFQGISPSQLAAFDAIVGVTGYLIEDFEDSTPVEGFTFQTGSHANLGASVRSDFPEAIWDGQFVGNDNVALGPIVMGYAPGTSSIGFGLGDVESVVSIVVNGSTLISDLRNLPNYQRVRDNAREVYVRIDAEIGDAAITEVSFVGSTGDFVFVDRVALNTTGVPEPSSFLLCLLGLAVLKIRRS